MADLTGKSTHSGADTLPGRSPSIGRAYVSDTLVDPDQADMEDWLEVKHFRTHCPHAEGLSDNTLIAIFAAVRSLGPRDRSLANFRDAAFSRLIPSAAMRLPILHHVLDWVDGRARRAPD